MIDTNKKNIKIAAPDQGPKIKSIKDIIIERNTTAIEEDTPKKISTKDGGEKKMPTDLIVLPKAIKAKNRKIQKR